MQEVARTRRGSHGEAPGRLGWAPLLALVLLAGSEKAQGQTTDDRSAPVATQEPTGQQTCSEENLGSSDGTSDSGASGAEATEKSSATTGDTEECLAGDQDDFGPKPEDGSGGTEPAPTPGHGGGGTQSPPSSPGGSSGTHGRPDGGHQTSGGAPARRGGGAANGQRSANGGNPRSATAPRGSERGSSVARDASLGGLPDPLPPARRLDRDFARELARIARRHEVDWGLVLAIIRARGGSGPRPASLEEVRALSRRLARVDARDDRLGHLVRGLFSRERFDLKVIALTRYNHAVGLRGLVKGLSAVEDRLAERVLSSGRLAIYPGGRGDIATGRVDVRVLTLLLYLKQKYDHVTVSSLITGHGFFARPRVPSLHSFGRAVDIAAVRDTPILGHQQPGGITEHVLRDILLLPDELRPQELISLFDLGGPSFAAADHDDHIHVGF